MIHRRAPFALSAAGPEIGELALLPRVGQLFVAYSFSSLYCILEEMLRNCGRVNRSLKVRRIESCDVSECQQKARNAVTDQLTCDVIRVRVREKVHEGCLPCEGIDLGWVAVKGVHSDPGELFDYARSSISSIAPRS